MNNDKTFVLERVSTLKFRAAQRYNISPSNCHIGHVVLQAMLENPHGIHQIDGALDANETNASVVVRSTRLASAMVNYGLKPGDVVALIGPNHLDLAIPYFACHYNGHPLCAMDPTITGNDIKVLFSYIFPKLVICPQSNIGDVKMALSGSGLDSPILTFDDTETDINQFVQKYRGTEINFRPQTFDTSKTIAWLMLTSGTTGLPKVAVITYDTLLNGICSWWEKFTDRFELTLAMGTIQWMSSLLFFISGPIMRYSRVQASLPLTPQLLIGLINKYRPNVTAWMPHLLNQFVMAAGNYCDLSCFKYIAIGGSAIEKDLLDRFRAKCGAFLYLVYGMTELLVPVFDYDNDTPFGSAGRSLQKFEYRIVDSETGRNLIAPYETGELWIKGDAFFKGYYNNSEETVKVLTEDGWVKTGDIFYKDDNNYYFFVERQRLLIRYTGLWISPLKLEEVLKQHPAVADACVVGVPDPTYVELPVAAVVAKEPNVDAKQIVSFVKEAMPEHQSLHGGVFFLDSLPTTPSGKVHRAKIRNIALSATRTGHA